jgi:hypothetical protein
MTVTNKAGEPITSIAERKDEIVRCITVIGWSWQKLADRLELRLPGVMAFKNCKRQSLADAHMALPRPMVTFDPEPVPAAPAGLPGGIAGLGPQPGQPDGVQLQPASQIVGNDVVKQIREEIAEQSTTAIVAAISGVYMAAVPGMGPDAMTSEQVAGARWALGELAQSMGVLDLVQDQLRLFTQQRAARAEDNPVVPGRIGADTRQPM